MTIQATPPSLDRRAPAGRPELRELVGAAGLGDGGGAARGRPRDGPIDPGRRAAGRAHRCAERPRNCRRTLRQRFCGVWARRGFLRSVTREESGPDEARAALLFGPDSPPGAAEAFAVERGRAARGRRPGRPPGGRRPARLGARHRDQAPRRRASRPRSPLPEPLAEPRLDFRVDRASALAYEVQRGRVHPDDRRAGPPVLGLPRLPPREARERARARHGRGHHAHADGRGLPAARPLQQVLRRGHGPARAGGAATRSAATTRSGSRARAATTRTWATPAT